MPDVLVVLWIGKLHLSLLEAIEKLKVKSSVTPLLEVCNSLGWSSVEWGHQYWKGDDSEFGKNHQ